MISFKLSTQRRSFPASCVDCESDFSRAFVRSLLQKVIDIAWLNSPQRIGKINFAPLRKTPFLIDFRDDHPLEDESGLIFADIRSGLRPIEYASAKQRIEQAWKRPYIIRTPAKIRSPKQRTVPV